jgi:hypothetical protein
VIRRTVAAATALMLAAPAHAALTEAPRLAAIYDSILAAQFDRAAALIPESCPPAPNEACKALAGAALWWQILVDPESRRLDKRLIETVHAAVEASTAWTRREPDDAEAWFYLGGSYAPLVQLRVLRGDRIAAARDANKIRAALERALQLDPDLDDAYFGIGMYHYYADVAPAYAKVLRWLLLLPGGDRTKGLREIVQARDHAQLLAGEADFQIQQIYLWYEHRPRDALALLESLDERYPSNPVFLERIAEVHDTYFHDLDASADAWQALLDRAENERVYRARMMAARARQQLRALAARRVLK